MVAEDDKKNKAFEERKKEIKMGNADLTNAEALERAEADLGYKKQNTALKWAQMIANDNNLTNEQKADYISLADFSVATIEDIESLKNAGVPIEDYVAVMSNLSDMGLKVKDDDLNADVKKAVTEQIYNMSGLDAKQKTALVRKTIGDDWIVDFSSEASFKIANELGKTAYKKYEEAKSNTGITAERYMELKEKMDNKAFKGTDDEGKQVYYLNNASSLTTLTLWTKAKRSKSTYGIPYIPKTTTANMRIGTISSSTKTAYGIRRAVRTKYP